MLININLISFLFEDANFAAVFCLSYFTPPYWNNLINFAMQSTMSIAIASSTHWNVPYCVKSY